MIRDRIRIADFYSIVVAGQGRREFVALICAIAVLIGEYMRTYEAKLETNEENPGKYQDFAHFPLLFGVGIW